MELETISFEMPVACVAFIPIDEQKRKMLFGIIDAGKQNEKIFVSAECPLPLLAEGFNVKVHEHKNPVETGHVRYAMLVVDKIIPFEEMALIETTLTSTCII